MKEDIKKQLILSCGVLVIVFISLFFWYDNFVFHTYIEDVDFQNCYQGQNDDFMVVGYELYQHGQTSYHGNERVICMNTDILKKGDQLKVTFMGIDDKDKEYTFEQTYNVKTDNEACLFNAVNNEDHIDYSLFKEVSMNLSINRNKKEVYNEDIKPVYVDLTTFNGGNKDYTIQNVYASPLWLKTGTFNSIDKDIIEQYDSLIVDYMLLKVDGNVDNIDDYERIISISQDIDEMIENPEKEVYFYDGEGSLLDRQIRCVITLKKTDDDNPLVFTIDLHASIKEGLIDES